MMPVQARAHSLLRQKEADLSKTRQETVQQFQEDLAAAEAATQAARQQLDQVLKLVTLQPDFVSFCAVLRHPACLHNRCKSNIC